MSKNREMITGITVDMLVTDNRQLGQLISGIAKAGRKLDYDTHLAACSCLLHIRRHGDSTKVTKLFSALHQAMPRSGRPRALAVWAEKFAPITVDRKTWSVKLKKGWKPEDIQVEKAISVQFWKLNPEKEPREFTLKQLTAYLARVAKGDMGEKTEVDADAMRAAERALAALTA